MTNSAALRGDAAESALCAYLSWIALVGIGLNAIWHIGWADAAAALIIVSLIALSPPKASSPGLRAIHAAERETHTSTIIQTIVMVWIW